MTDLRIEYMALTKLKRAPRNPKEHDLGMLHSSIARFGFVSPIILDEQTGRLVAGHGRLDALQQMKASGKGPPERVVAENGEWLVPVIRGVAFDDEREAEAYLLADNRATELGGWDESALAEVLADFAADDALEGMGWDVEDVDALLKAAAPDRWDDEGPAEPELTRWDVPDALWASDNEYDVPMLDINMQAKALALPVTKWGTVGRRGQMKGTYHFYTDDYKFNAVWDDPTGIVVSGCENVVEVSYSTGAHYPGALGLWLIYKKRWLARYWQSMAVRVFVDVDVTPKFFDIALLGVPRGWRAYATRWMQNLDDMYGADLLDRKYALAREHAGEATPLFVVFGGRESVAERCKANGWVHVAEYSSKLDGK